MEEAASFLTRYRSGEQEAVCLELEDCPDDPGAWNVAVELMDRVRKNVATLAERWKEHGFELPDPVGKPDDPVEAEALEWLAEHGAIPVALRAFYARVGWIDFVARPPSDRWPDREGFDPLQVFALSTEMDRYEELREPDDFALDLFLDPLTKMDFSGVGPIHTPPLPIEGFDVRLWFEGSPTSMSLIPYLRESILQQGGVGAFAQDDAQLDSELIRELTKGLLPF